MEFIFSDYANWKLENEKLIFTLIDRKSDIISRFKHIYDVTEYLHEEAVEKGKLETEEMDIFESGFGYLFDEFQNIETILNEYFDGDYDEMEESSELVNLLLYVNEFQAEILSLDHEVDKDDEEALGKFSDEITELIKNKGQATDELHEELDQIVLRIFGVSYYGVNEIFLDIADELGIIDYDFEE